MTKKKSFIETIEGEAIHEAEDYFKNKIRKRAIKISEMSASFLLGFILLIIGVAEFMSAQFPILEGGFNYLILGIIFILIGLILR